MTYKLLQDDTIDHEGRTLYRIRYEDGTLGGYLESTDNLSQEGNAKVLDNAKVYGSAKVCGDAEVYGDAKVFGDAKVYGHAWVSGDAQVYGDAKVYGHAWMFDNAQVSKTPRVVTTLWHTITVTDHHLSIGCEQHTYAEWLANYRAIGTRHGLTDEQVAQYYDIIKRLTQ